VNANKVLAGEFFLAIGINSWGALKQGDAPWPPTIIASCIAMAILSMASAIDERLAVLFGAGFLMASIMNTATGGSGQSSAATLFNGTFGAIPPSGTYDILSINSGSASNGSGNSGNGGQSNGQS
jgi:hypothetical protein